MNHMQTGRGLRWRIAWILFFSTVINYINRRTFPLLTPVISAQLHFAHEDLSRIFGSFQLAYAWTWLIGGVLLDLIVTRAGLSLTFAVRRSGLRFWGSKQAQVFLFQQQSAPVCL
jgi:MFS transporter, ACS family, hexuronate transporter